MTTIGVITGLKFEADILRKGSRHKKITEPTLASVAGRQDHAFEEAKAMVEAGARALISFGIAGGLSDDTPVGSLVLADKVYCGKGSVFETEKAWRETLMEVLHPEIVPVVNPMVSLDYALETEADKRGAHDQTGAVGVDMESFGTARAAKEMGVPFLVIRSISDAAEDTLPACLVPAMGPGGVIMMGPIFTGIAKNPADLVHMIGFGMKTAKANRTLRRVALLGLPHFGLAL